MQNYKNAVSRYNDAWKEVLAMRHMIQNADKYLAAYGVEHQANDLHFRSNPRTRVDKVYWPSAQQISETVTRLKQLGEEVVVTYNALPLQERYLVKVPETI